MSGDGLELRDVHVRRLGSGVVHAARVPALVMFEATVFGSPCTGVHTPIVARCGVGLRGDAIVIPEGEPLDGWRKARKLCPVCEAILSPPAVAYER